MITHDLKQGSSVWYQHRATHFNASDAPAMMGVSPYKTRSQLLHEIATGITPDVDAGTQQRFDEGHRAEALARPLAEQIIGEELYPVVGSNGRLSASFDGLTMDEQTGFEHKSLNDEIRACKTVADLPLMYRIQMEQQLMVADAGKILFMATKWNGHELLEEKHFWYQSDPKLREDIARGWAQFETDLATYTPPEPDPVVVAAPILSLPAVMIQVNGQLALTSNLDLFEQSLRTFIKRLPESPSTDQEFADCKAACGALKEAQDALDAAEAHALGQIATFDAMKRQKAMLVELARTTRLALDKLVTAREKAIKEEIVMEATTRFAEHIVGLNKRLGKPYMPPVKANWQEAIKNKRTLASLRNAVDTELARVKIEANAVADAIQINLNTLRELAANHAFLFADTAQIVLKANDDLTVLVKARIAEHETAEAKRKEAEREKIRAEEQAKAQREAEAKIRAAQEAAQKAAAQQEVGAEKLSEGTGSPESRTGKPVPTPAVAAAPITTGAGTLRAKIAQEMADMSPGELQQVLDACREIRAARQRKAVAA